MKYHPFRTAVLLLLTSLNGLLYADAPANDNFANAIHLGSGLSANATGTLDEATVEIDEPLIRFDEWFFDYVGSTIWWTWTCPAGSNRLVTVSTAGSDEDGIDPVTFDRIRVPHDTLLMIFSGDDFLSLVPIAESNDVVEDDTSRAVFIATPGTTYRIRVDSREWFPFSTIVKLALTAQATPVTADEHVAWGKARLTYRGGWDTGTEASKILILAGAALDSASNHFQSARNLLASHPEANVFGALVSLLKLQKEGAFNTLLTQLGIEDLALNPDAPDYSLPEDINGKPMFAGGADSGQVLNYLKASVRPRLQAMLAMLEKVTSTTFLGTFPDHIRFFESVYIDYGDVVMLQGWIKAFLGLIDFLESYNLLAPLQEMADLSQADMLDAQHIGDALDSLLKFSGSDKRLSAKTNLQAAIALYNKASTHIRTSGKRPLARDEFHLFGLRENPDSDTELRADLDKINKSLGGTTITEDDWSYNLNKLLTGTLSLRAMSPNFKESQVIRSSVLNPTFGGVLPGASTLKVENYLRDRNALYEGLLALGAQIAPGHELFGSIGNPGGMFLPGVVTTLTAAANPGYRFGGWKFNELLINSVSPYTFPVIREYTLLAHFDQDTRDDDNDGLSNYSETIVFNSNPTDADSDDDGWPDGLDEFPNTPDARQFAVSQNLQNISMDLPVGQILSITGLPPGVTYDAVHQRLVGRPNAITTATKIFALKATVKPATGANFFLNLTLTVQALPATLFGTFNGLVDLGTLSSDLGGSVSFSITNSGIITGKIILAGRSYSFPANLRLNTQAGSSIATCTIPPIPRTAPLKPLLIAFTIGTNLNELTGTVAADGFVPLNLFALRSPWSITPKNPLVQPYVGTYNASLAPSDHVGDLAYPQGSGFSTLKITDTGTATWGGKLADGSIITGGSTLGPNGEVPLHVMLYLNTGSIQGWSQIVSTNLDSMAPHVWTKKPQPASSTTRSYKGGFPAVLGVVMDGSRYTAPPTIFSYLTLLASAGKAQLDFTQGNLDAPFSQVFTINAPATVVMPNTTALNPNKVTLTFTPSTGLFTGSFTLPGPPARKADFSGAIIPHLNRGVAHFTLPQTPVPPQTSANSPILSGKASLGPKP